MPLAALFEKSVWTRRTGESAHSFMAQTYDRDNPYILLAQLLGVILPDIKDADEFNIELTKRLIARLQVVLRDQMLQYRNASFSDRKASLAGLYGEIRAYKDSIDAKGDIPLEQRVVFEGFSLMTSNLFRYVDALHAMELGGRPVKIQGEFCGMASTVMKLEKYTILNDYFEFPGGPFIIFKRPLKEIPGDIFILFQQAQNEYLHDVGKSATYNLDPMMSQAVFSEALFPVPMQTFGVRKNRAVDSPRFVENKVIYAKRYGAYLLPAGGQLEVDFNVKELHGKFVLEALEEQCGALHASSAAQKVLNEVTAEQALATIKGILEHDAYKQFAGDLMPPYSAEDVEARRVPQTSQLLLTLIRAIDEMLKRQDPEKENLLQDLRAAFQVDLFALTEVFAEIIGEFKEHCVIVPIEQFCDTRRMGGEQVAHTALTRTGYSPIEIICRHLPDMQAQFGSDLTYFGLDKGAEYVELTTLGALVHTGEVNFSHDISAWAAVTYNCMGSGVGLEAALSTEAMSSAGVCLKEFFDNNIKPVVRTLTKQAEQADRQWAEVVTPQATLASDLGVYNPFRPT